MIFKDIVNNNIGYLLGNVYINDDVIEKVKSILEKVF